MTIEKKFFFTGIALAVSLTLVALIAEQSDLISTAVTVRAQYISIGAILMSLFLTLCRKI